MTKASTTKPKAAAPATKAAAPAAASKSTRGYNQRLVAKAKGLKPGPGQVVPKKSKVRKAPKAPVANGLRPRASMKKTSTGALAAGPDDPKYTALTPIVCQAFLAALSVSGRPTQVARELRIHYLSLRVMYREDEEFKKCWDESMAAAFEHQEDEVRRRAFTGYQKPVYQQGMLVGHVTEYSDSLATLMIKAGKPEIYNPKTTQLIEHAGSVAYTYAHMSDDDLNDAINKKLRWLGAVPPNTEGFGVDADDVLDTKELNKSAGAIE